MHPQLEAILAELSSVSDRVHRLASAVPDERWWERPAGDGWSVGECIAHLNITARAFRPVVEQALEEARRRMGAVPARYPRGLLGGLLWRVLGRNGRFRVKTAAAFVPPAGASRGETVDEFDRLQAEQAAWVRAADGLPLQRVRIVSPFNGRVRYNLFAALSILARHQARHLWQAEQAWSALLRR
jgi:hypothetical protein